MSVAASRADRWSSVSIAGLALQLLAEVARHRSSVEPSRPPWIDRVCEAIRKQPAAKWPLAKLAALAEVHPAHLVRAFRGHVGTTVGEFIRAERLEGARRLIEQTPISIAEISVMAGFYDQGHLGRIFKSFFGLTPVEYRIARRPGTKALTTS
jgi:AraC family transcriptional regulator